MVDIGNLFLPDSIHYIPSPALAPFPPIINQYIHYVTIQHGRARDGEDLRSEIQPLLLLLTMISLLLVLLLVMRLMLLLLLPLQIPVLLLLLVLCFCWCCFCC